MDIFAVIITGFVFLAFGTFLGWLIAKTKVATKVAELNMSLTSEQLLRSEIQNKYDALAKLDSDKQAELNQLKTDNAVLLSKFEKSTSQIKEVENTLELLKKDIEDKGAKLTQALQDKTAAETLVNGLKDNINALQQKETHLNNELETIRNQITSIKEENASLIAKGEEIATRLKEQEEFISQANKQLQDSFASLSISALKENNLSFVELAKAKLDEKVAEAKGEFEKKELAIQTLVKPLGDSLKVMDTKIQEMEDKRLRAYSDIWNYLDTVKSTTEGLKKETSNLVGALKTSHSRGRYGEIALRRLVEHAGMFEHCDFEEQVSVEDDNGKLRPDMIIKLPGSKTLVVDSKSPLSAYLKIFETDDSDQQKILLSQHITAIKDHLKKLSAKAYWSQFDDAPDFVIMYIHIESSYGAALQAWPEMIEEAMKNRIIIATPTVLLSILMGVGYSWNQLKTMENIESIRDAAVELHDRSAVLIEHLVNIGTGLKSTVNNYNKSIGSLESSFIPQAKKINSLSQAYAKKQIPDIGPIEVSVRPVVVTPLITEQSQQS